MSVNMTRFLYRLTGLHWEEDAKRRVFSCEMEDLELWATTDADARWLAVYDDDEILWSRRGDSGIDGREDVMLAWEQLMETLWH
jgi:hypothetical protein